MSYNVPCLPAVAYLYCLRINYLKIHGLLYYKMLFSLF